MSQRSVSVKHRKLFLLRALALLAVFVPGATIAQTVVMTGLDNPRGLAFGPEGALYVAEAGRGPSDPSCFASPLQDQCTCATRASGATICSGPTGAVSRLWHGQQRRVVEGLPSWTNAMGRAQGPNGIAMLGLGAAYVTIGLEASPDSVDLLRAGLGSEFGRLARIHLPTGAWDLVADLAAYEQQFNPDPRVVDSNPFGLLVEPSGVVIADSGGNDLLRVAANGAIATLAVLPPVSHGNGDPVPTSVTIGPDGAYYVGLLTAAPFVAGASTIYRLVPGAAPQAYLTGFKTVMGLAFDQEGNLYVLQHATGAVFSGAGVLIRVAPDGTRATVMAGLDRPTGVTVGPDGAPYVTNHGLVPGQGEVLRIEP